MERKLTGFWRSLAYWIAFVFAIFQIYTAGFGALPDLRQRAIHVTLGLTLCLILYSFNKKTEETKLPLWDVLLIILVVIANVNIFLKYEKIYLFPGESTVLDRVLGVILFLIIIELCRRVLGWAVPALVGIALVYLFIIGPYVSGTWGLVPLSPKFVINSLYYSNTGMYGMLTGISATLVATFIVFGALLLYAAGGQTFIDLALILAGRFRGGPAKVAVVGSAMFATVSGSPIANVLTTGNFTIPLMKRGGYPANFAGAVEAVASTGGSITPPIMGASAFIMAEILGVPYAKICVYAMIPALLFYTCVIFGVHAEAMRLKLPRIPEEEIPSLKSILTWPKLGPFVIPIAVLLIMMTKGYSIIFAGFGAIIAVIVTYMFSDISPEGLKERFIRLGTIFNHGGKALVTLVPLMVCLSMLVNLLSLSGVLVKLSALVITIGASSFVGALITAALVPLLLGMAVPPAGAYVLAMAIVAPALIKLNVPTIPANMFLLYTSILAPITPPICAAVLVAAQIAKTPWFKVSVNAVKLGMVAFVIPFFFVINPALLTLGTPGEVIQVVISGLVGVVFLGSGFFGYLFDAANVLSRLLYVAGGFLLLFPTVNTDIIGIIICVIGLVINLVTARNKISVAALKSE